MKCMEEPKLHNGVLLIMEPLLHHKNYHLTPCLMQPYDYHCIVLLGPFYSGLCIEIKFIRRLSRQLHKLINKVDKTDSHIVNKMCVLHISLLPEHVILRQHSIQSINTFACINSIESQTQNFLLL